MGKIDSVNRWQSVIAKGNANNNAVHNYALEISDANRFVCMLANGSATTMLTSTVAATKGQFTHVTCVWNGSNLQLYINWRFECLDSPESYTVSKYVPTLYWTVWG